MLKEQVTKLDKYCGVYLSQFIFTNQETQILNYGNSILY